MTRYNFTLKSRNAKTGPMPVSTTSSDTCPTACPFIDSGCYAEAGPLAILWRKLDADKVGINFDEFVAKIAALPTGTIWRHNQAGDLPGSGNTIDAAALARIVAANKGRRGFTYTHKPTTRANVAAVKAANSDGFTINLSANNLTHADVLADAGAGPVVVVLPADQTANTVTPAGRVVVVCPATQSDTVTCLSCQLCQRVSRKTIVGFPAHGAAKRRASAIAAA